MKLSFSRILTVLAAAAVIAVLGWETHVEYEEIEKANRESVGGARWTYDGGGWLRGAAMLLSAGIIVLQVGFGNKTSTYKRH